MLKEVISDADSVTTLKAFELLISFIFEDFVSVGIQYFYFEKYQFLNDTFANIKAGFMVMKLLEPTIRVTIRMGKEVDFKQESF